MTTTPAVAAVAEAIWGPLVDHPMWIGDDGEPLDYLPERESRLGDFTDQAATKVLECIRDAIHRDGTDADAIREALGLPTGGTHNHYFLNRALCGAESKSMHRREGMPDCPECAAIYAALPDADPVGN